MKTQEFTKMVTSAIESVSSDKDGKADLLQLTPTVVSAGFGTFGAKVHDPYVVRGTKELKSALKLANKLLAAQGIRHLEAVQGHEFPKESLFGETLDSEFRITIQWKNDEHNQIKATA